jgi:hypothetical protein
MGVDDHWDAFLTMGYGSAPPTEGARPNGFPHEQGEIVWNSAPEPGSTLGWVCVESGTEGSPAGEWRPLEIGTARSVACSDEYLVVGQDRHVTVQAPGKTVTLPADPVDGERHEIKAGGAFTVEINGNGKTIDGSLSYVQNANRECTTVRFSAATAEWEVVAT